MKALFVVALMATALVACQKKEVNPVVVEPVVVPTAPAAGTTVVAVPEEKVEEKK